MSIKLTPPSSHIEVSEYLPFSECISGFFCLLVRIYYSSSSKIACEKTEICLIFPLFSVLTFRQLY